MRLRLAVSIIGFLFIVMQAVLAPAMAQADKLNKKELDQLLAPIALYPDDLLSNILMASTYPLDVVQAARWVKGQGNAKLKGDALTKALESQKWDPSIKALVQFPTVLQNMSDKLDWTQKLGEAFLAQQDELMDQIQFLRQKADEAGHLKSTKQQKVTKNTEGGGPVYVIEPVDPNVVYVPYYQPTVVYGNWWYDDYPPYYWGYPGASYVDGWWWGAGIPIAAAIWGWNHCDWRRHNINVDVNKWNNINHNRNRITDGKWAHRPEHRGQAAYRNKELRDKFAQGDRKLGSRDNIDRSKVEARLKNTDRSNIKGKISNPGRANIANNRARTANVKGARAKTVHANNPRVQHRAAHANVRRVTSHQVNRAAVRSVGHPRISGGGSHNIRSFSGGGRSFGGGGRGGGGFRGGGGGGRRR
jgi:hypothetical protein